MGCGCRQLGQAAGLDPRRAETQRSWGRLGAGEKLGRILDSGEKGYQRTLYGVDFTFAMAGARPTLKQGRALRTGRDGVRGLGGSQQQSLLGEAA